MPRRTWKTYENVQLELSLSIEEDGLYNRALKMYEAKAGMGELAQLYLDNKCILYRGRTGSEVVQLPLYHAIKDMAKRRGIADGLLSDRPGSSPDLDTFKAKN